MREAIGGAMTIQIIVIFMLLINAYLAFSVSYTRAFKMKNQVINIIENNEGYPMYDEVSTCTADNPEGAVCQIVSYINQIGYNGVEFADNDDNCPKGAKGKKFGLCIIPHKKDIAGNSNASQSYSGIYYTVYTYININIPVINNLFKGMPNIFRIQGETNTIYSSGLTNIFTEL